MVDRAGQIIDATRLANSVEWLENEQRNNREAFSAVASQMQRFQAFLDEQAEYSRAVEESLVAVRQTLGRMAMIEETANQTRDQLGRVEAIVAEVEKATVQFQRIVETENENMRIGLSELQHAQQAMTGRLDQTEGRLRSIDEGERRRQDSIGLIEERHNDLVKLAEAADTRSRSAGEQIKRTYDDLEQMSRHLGALVSQDELLSSRLQVVAEQIRGVDDKVDRVAVELEPFRPLGDRMDVLRAEHQRVAHEVGSLIQNYGHVNDKADDLGRQVRDQAGRNREAFDKMMALRQEVWDFAQQTQEHVVALLRIEERQKRREISEIEQQIKELRAHKVNLGQERLE